MAVYPGAKYRPLNQFSNQGTRPRLGVVLHVNDSDGPSLYNWIAGNNNMSCHFQVAKDGTVEQYIDTDNGSWCQMNGNDTYLSIETQGFPTEPLTAAQVTACAGIMRWAHATHGIPLQLAETPGQPGLIWHGAGGSAWGGHTGCPGDLRKAQRAKILALAGGSPSTTPGDDMSAADVAAITARIDTLETHIHYWLHGQGELIAKAGLDPAEIQAAVKAAMPTASSADAQAVAAAVVAKLATQLGSVTP